MKDILQEITRLRTERGWSEYDLAVRAGITQSTISTWYRKQQIPTIKSLERICAGLGITLSQFFAEGEDLVSLTQGQRDLLDAWACLSREQQANFMELFRHI